MRKSAHKISSINRIIDANINRAKEGLRVCEEITRFLLDNPRLTSQLKALRHKIELLLPGLATKIELIQERNSRADIGAKIYGNELKRDNIKDIFFANIQRVKESVRVLEEFAKLLNKNTAVKFKEIRYATYELEKKIAKIIQTQYCCR